MPYDDGYIIEEVMTAEGECLASILIDREANNKSQRIGAYQQTFLCFVFVCCSVHKIIVCPHYLQIS